eukprot:JP440290.1.p3 GENE.JP440290.1~~JP440290.1.p3  ORF type:complete len:50 (+),score=1.18 JP440290.1:102-251(+)
MESAMCLPFQSALPFVGVLAFELESDVVEFSVYAPDVSWRNPQRWPFVT